ncbi:MAG TPA: YiiX/YebB-like N1pC/P60 family cysteine hydrolase [Burkholderiales bacterium]|nr:YiiX/YebB-like N1pC/P60 family cysteine hydrolase [Burkholderiales bacterium]
MNPVLRWMGGRLARYLSTPIRGAQAATASLEQLAAALKPGDVLLVEGNTRVSTAIKYLTQSTWSHATFYVGDALGASAPGEAPRVLIEADMLHGIRAVPLSDVSGLNSRICRPVGLSKEDLQKVIQFAVSHIGGQYDLKNVFDLARYLIPTPPVPTRWRRRLIAFGSGDPTRAICSTLIAEAFQSVHYPILPEVTFVHDGTPGCNDCYHEVMHIRHYSLFTPRDFDISPYFEVVKPTIASDFDYHKIAWAQESPAI